MADEDLENNVETCEILCQIKELLDSGETKTKSEARRIVAHRIKEQKKGNQ